LVGDDGRVRVIDFGLARGEEFEQKERRTSPGGYLDTKITAEGTYLGTPAYMPPEQRAGKRDARSDQYAFCVTLAEALCGLRPRQGELEAAHRQLPGWLRRLLERGLAEDAAQRFPSMDALLEELERGVRWQRRWTLIGVAVLASAL